MVIHFMGYFVSWYTCTVGENCQLVIADHTCRMNRAASVTCDVVTIFFDPRINRLQSLVYDIHSHSQCVCLVLDWSVFLALTSLALVVTSFGYLGSVLPVKDM